MHTSIQECEMEAGPFNGYHFKPRPQGSLHYLTDGIAHDLNNQFAPILVSVGFLRETAADESTRKIYDIIENCARRGSQLVQQIRTFTHAEENSYAVLDPSILLRDLRKYLEKNLPPSIQMRSYSPVEAWPILGSLEQVYRALLRLCLNGAEAMPNGGILSIGVENELMEGDLANTDPDLEQARYVRFTIRDIGPGVPLELQKTIFESDATAGPNGCTLGRELSSTNAIIEAHGGILTLESENGFGTIFRAHFPTAPKKPSESAMPGSGPPQGHGEWILVVDDDEAMICILKSTLELFGFHVINARDGIEAVGRYREHRNEVALVLMNIALADFDGFTTAHALHKISPSVKIIAFSGLKTKILATMAAKIGITDFLFKPFSANDLLRVVANALPETESKLEAV